MMKQFSQIIFGLLVLNLTACGFHLRGDADVPELLQSLYVQGVDLRQNAFGLELKRALTRNGVKVLDSYQEGTSILTILDNRYNKRVLSVGTDAKVREYELEAVVRYKVTDDKGQIIQEQQTVEARRDYQFDSDQVLASDEQERVLREDLNKQLAQSLLRRLSAIQ